MNVLKKINSMRLARGWSVYHLAVAADLPQSTLINMMNRETLPSLTTLEHICNAFGVTMSEFFREDSDDRAPSEEEEFERLYRSLTKKQAKLVVQLMKELNKDQPEAALFKEGK